MNLNLIVSKLKSFFKNLFIYLKTHPLILFLSIIVLLIIFFSLSLKPSISPPTTDSDQLPQPKLTLFNPPQAPSYPDLPDQSLPTKDFVYTIPGYPEHETRAFFNQIAAEFKFPNPPTTINIKSEPHLYWKNSTNFLTVNLNTAQFTLDLHPTPATHSGKISQADAVFIAKSWLTRYHLINEDAQINTTPLSSHQNEYAHFTSKDQVATAYQIEVNPHINNRPLYSPHLSTQPINLTINQYGQILNLYYNLPSLFYSEIVQHPEQLSSKQQSVNLVSTSQVLESIKDSKPTITDAITPSGKPAPLSTIQSVNYQNFNLGYQFISPNKIIPIIKLTGTSTDASYTPLSISAYLPAY